MYLLPSSETALRKIWNRFSTTNTKAIRRQFYKIRIRKLDLIYCIMEEHWSIAATLGWSTQQVTTKQALSKYCIFLPYFTHTGQVCYSEDWTKLSWHSFVSSHCKSKPCFVKSGYLHIKEQMIFLFILYSILLSIITAFSDFYNC